MRNQFIKELYQNYTEKNNKTKKINNNEDPRKSNSPKYNEENVSNHKDSQSNINIA